MSEPLASTSRAALVATLSSRAEKAREARYPLLFQPSARPEAEGYKRLERAGTGIVVTTALHEQLTDDERRAIGEFRLDQYVLAGMYDAELVEREGIETDPAMGLLEPADVHVAVGDAEGRFLSYMCMQSPLRPSQPADEDAGARRLKDRVRPVFPCETEYGVELYGDHPGLANLPLRGVRELTRLVRNQALRTPFDAVTVVEAVVAISRVVCDPYHHIEAIVGCASPEVRRLLFRLGVPVAYAPEAVVIGDNASGSAPNGHLIWTRNANAPGRFWPFALASADILPDQWYYDRLDAALALPAMEIAGAIQRAQHQGPLRPPRYCLPEDVEGEDLIWTANPFRGSES